MQLWEGIRLAFRQIRTEKLKSFFAVLGVIIGVMFLLVVVSVVEGMDRYIRDDFASEIFGINTITVWRYRSGPTDTNQRRRRNPVLTYEDAEILREGLSVPARVGIESDVSGEVRGDNGRKVENVRLIGISPEIFRIRDYKVSSGRVFSAQEAERGVPVVVLGKSTAETLYDQTDPLGRTVRIDDFPYRVIGVLEEQGSLFGISLDNLAITPARSPAETLINPRGVIETVIIQTLDPADLVRAEVEAEGILRAAHRLRPAEPNDFALETADEALSFWDTISRVLFLALPMLVGISLVVGGIVIMNIMLVSVMERTREIGVRKALGARRRDILFQVVIESATLSGVGAAVGVALGLGLATVVDSVSPLPAAIDPFWATFGVGLGVGVGMVAGVYPAWRASKLDPIDALRYE